MVVIAGLPPALNSPVPIYIWVERGTARGLAQEHKTICPARAPWVDRGTERGLAQEHKAMCSARAPSRTG